jgi:hypothetical protein
MNEELMQQTGRISLMYTRGTGPFLPNCGFSPPIGASKVNRSNLLEGRMLARNS